MQFVRATVVNPQVLHRDVKTVYYHTAPSSKYVRLWVEDVLFRLNKSKTDASDWKDTVRLYVEIFDPKHSLELRHVQAGLFPMTNKVELSWIERADYNKSNAVLRMCDEIMTEACEVLDISEGEVSKFRDLIEKAAKKSMIVGKTVGMIKRTKKVDFQ